MLLPILKTNQSWASVSERTAPKGFRDVVIFSTPSFDPSSVNKSVFVAAESIWNRFETMVGVVTPENVRKFSKEEIASCGITRPKSGYILGLANDAENLLNFPYTTSSTQDIQKHLIQFKGVGPWTAEMVMIFAILLPDIYSPKDIGLVNAIKRLFPEVETMEQAEEVAKRWAPYRTMACWYLWRMLDPIEY